MHSPSPLPDFIPVLADTLFWNECTYMQPLSPCACLRSLRLRPLLGLEPQQIWLGATDGFGTIALPLVKGLAAFVERIHEILALLLLVPVLRKTI